MIVKNEAHVIERCLNSALPMLDFVRVVDTGSTDDTVHIIRKWCMDNGINCMVRLSERDNSEGFDFAANRNDALAFARECEATHLLLIDADEVLHINAREVAMLRTKLAETEDVGFVFPMLYGTNVCVRTNLVRNTERVAYRFPHHEELLVDGTTEFKLTMIGSQADVSKGPHVTTPQDGARSMEEGGVQRDLFALGKAYEADHNPRHIFYMGQMLRIIAHKENTPESWQAVREVYTEYLRAMSGNYQPHCYVAALWVARVMEMEGRDPESVIATYQKVHNFDPGRPEAMGQLASFCFDMGDTERAIEYAEKVESCRGSNNYAFLETKWYEKAKAILEATTLKEV
jgi:glycosyltransferase involved in cell wall biosynthesis